MTDITSTVLSVGGGSPLSLKYLPSPSPKVLTLKDLERINYINYTNYIQLHPQCLSPDTAFAKP